MKTQKYKYFIMYKNGISISGFESLPNELNLLTNFLSVVNHKSPFSEIDKGNIEKIVINNNKGKEVCKISFKNINK